METREAIILTWAIVSSVFMKQWFTGLKRWSWLSALAVKRIVGYPVEFSADQMDMHVKEMAKFWGRIQARNFDPESMGDAARLVYKQDSGQSLVATHTLEEQVKVLRLIKDQIKDLEDKEEKLAAAVQGYMMEAAQLTSVDGSVLATWKTSKASKRFSAELFKQSMPEMYDKFVVEQPGSRRFLVK